MNNRYRTLIAAGGCAFFAACGNSVDPIVELPRALSIAEGKLVDADSRFAFKLFREVSEQDAGKNLFISPIAMAALGLPLIEYLWLPPISRWTHLM